MHLIIIRLLAVLLLISEFSYAQFSSAPPSFKSVGLVLDSLANVNKVQFGGLPSIGLLTCPLPSTTPRDYFALIVGYCNNSLVSFRTAGKTTHVKATQYGDSVQKAGSTIIYLRHGHDEPAIDITLKVNGRSVGKSDTSGLIVLPRIHQGDTLHLVGTVQVLDTSLQYDGRQVLRIDMEVKETIMEDVVVKATTSNGYTAMPKETSTFSTEETPLDPALRASTLGNTITDAASRVVPGYYRSTSPVPGGASATGTLHGPSSLRGNDELVHVLEEQIIHFPGMINPADVKSLTAGKDAPMLAQHGSEGAAGFILMDMRDAVDEAPGITATLTFGFGEKANPRRRRWISSPDYMQLEAENYKNGVYALAEATNQALSPYVEALSDRHNGRLTQPGLDSITTILEKQDLWKELDNHYYKRSGWQQYDLRIAGKKDSLQYYGSMSHHRYRQAERGNQEERTTFYASTLYRNKKLQLTSRYFVTMTQQSFNTFFPAALYPYLSLANAAGIAQPMPYQLRSSYTDTLANGQYKDLYGLRPLQEWDLSNNRLREQYLSFQQSLNYQLFPQLRLKVLYQWTRYSSRQNILYDAGSYFARDQQLHKSEIDANGMLQFRLPAGDALDASTSLTRIQDARLQADYEMVRKAWRLTVMAGTEAQLARFSYTNNRYFGYQSLQQLTVPGVKPADSVQFRWSMFTGATATMWDRLVISLSARNDQDNRFGPHSLWQGLFYSVGTRLLLERFGFYPKKWPKLHLLASTGESGNAGQTPRQPTQIFTTNSNGLPVATIVQPANLQLQPERTRMTNIGLKLYGLKNRYTVSFDYFWKYCYDLHGLQKVSPFAGFSTVTANSSALKAEGFDLSAIIQYGRRIRYTTTSWLSLVRSRVTKEYFTSREVITLMQQATYVFQPGAAPNTIYAFPAASLDSLTGNARGYLNGKPSMAYDAIVKNKDSSTLKNMGSALPLYYGSINQQIQFNPWLSFSFQVSVRLKYVYRRPTYGSTGLVAGSGINGDYYDAWKKPGDEKYTSIPVYNPNSTANQELFNIYNEHRVQPADNIKIENLQLGIKLTKRQVALLPCKEVLCYFTAFSPCFLWRKNDYRDDPDAINRLYDTPRSYSVSITVHY
jgi:hypothetical protein